MQTYLADAQAKFGHLTDRQFYICSKWWIANCCNLDQFGWTAQDPIKCGEPSSNKARGNLRSLVNSYGSSFIDFSNPTNVLDLLCDEFVIPPDAIDRNR